MYYYLAVFAGKAVLLKSATIQATNHPDIIELSEQCYLFMKEKAEIEEFNADLTFLVG
jgi:hypothetical protein